MESGTLSGVVRHGPAFLRERIAAWAALAAAAVAVVALLGWTLSVPELRRFAATSKDLWPLSATGYLALSGAVLAILRGRHPLALGLLAVPVLIGTWVVLERLTGWSAGLNLLLFSDAVRQVPARMPGRPGMLTAASFVALPAAVALAIAGSRRAGWMIALLASVCLAAAVFSIALLIMPATPGEASALAVAPLPGAVATIALAVGLLAWRGESGWAGLLALADADRVRYAVAFPLILLIPTLTTIIGLVLIRQDLISPVDAAAVSSAVNVLAFAGLLFWTTERVVRDRSALEEISRAMDSAPIAITDQHGRIAHWSRGCEELYGFTAAEAVGRLKRELVRSQPARPSGIAAVTSPDVTAGEWIEKRADGTPIHVLERRRHLHFYGREPIVVLKMTDISDRIAIEDELRLSRTRLEVAVEAHEVGVFEWDVATGTISWSAGSEQRLGLTSGSLSSFDRWAALVDPTDVQSVGTTIAEATRRKEPRFSFSYRFRQPNGKVRAVEGSAHCFYDDEGALTRTVGVVIDVTRHNEREAVLQSREAQLRSVLETVPDAMIVVDETGRIESFSRAAEELLGYRGEDLVGRDFSLLVPGGLAARELGYRRLFSAGHQQRNGKGEVLHAVHASGAEIPVELRLGSTRVGGHRLFTAFLRDLRASIESEERLSRLREELAHVGRLSAMGELAAGLAHELNQPLAASVNFLATAEMLLRAHASDEQVSEMIALASSQNKRAGEIIRRMRAFVSRHEPEVFAEPVEETIRDAVALVMVGQSQRAVRVEFDLDPKAKLMFADRVQIQQVLVNLVRNAAEAMESGAASSEGMLIEVGSRATADGMVEICVRDRGPGVPSEMLEQMFTPFRSTKQSGGMGIGLTICRRIVEAHGGELIAENMPDGGARFRFTLPMITEKELGEA